MSDLSSLNRTDSDDRQRAGILIIGHGTRDAAGVAEFHALAGMIAERLAPQPVEAGFLEIEQPTIGQACEVLVARGATSVQALPMLLFAAGHAKHDIPEALAVVRAKLGIAVTQAPHLGCDAALRQLAKRRMTEALATRNWLAEDCQLVIVGRGSPDPVAQREATEWSEFRAADSRSGQTSLCFVAMAQPSLAEGLASAAASHWRQIVVQPHLLFRGRILDSIHAAVVQIARGEEQRWIIAEPLGPEPELVEAALRRVSSPASRG